MKSILIIEDDPLVRKTLASQLAKKGFEVSHRRDGRGGRPDVRGSRPDIVLLDVRLPDIDGLEVLRQIRERSRRAIILVMTAFDDMKTTVEAIKLGAFEYLVKPLNAAELELAIDKAFQVRAPRGEGQLSRRGEAEGIHHRQHHRPLGRDERASSSSSAPWPTPGPTSSSRARAAPARSSSPRPSTTTVPSGTSPSSSSTARPSRTPCSKSELFGHVKGAFTDAVSETKGKFEIAGKGTLFLDEVGDVSPNLQSKLLRVIETRDFMKVGGEKVLKTEARIIAATNQNLKGLIEKGRFREDLYYRLKVVEIALPPLRERREDIPDLVGLPPGKDQPGPPPQRPQGPARSHEDPRRHPLAGKRPRARERPDPGRHPGQGGRHPQGEPAPRAGRKAVLHRRARPSRRGREKYIQYVLNAAKGSKTRASQILQISRPTLDKKIREYGLELGEPS